MHNVKTLPALLCLLLAVGPTAVLSAPIADVASLDKRQVTHSNTDAASVVGAGIPDGPSFNQGDFFSTSSDEQRDEDCDEDEDNDGSSSSPSASSSSNTGAASFMNAGIPDGPSFNQNDFFSTSNDEDRDVGDGDDGSQSGFSTSTDAGNFATDAYLDPSGSYPYLRSSGSSFFCSSFFCSSFCPSYSYSSCPCSSCPCSSCFYSLCPGSSFGTSCADF
ncbi:hypothetical protein CNMCM8057_003012 [Aspergillus fumigatus]|nr:hypothetical protein CNMCM8057_003012 [Aspergillus fumigatus]